MPIDIAPLNVLCVEDTEADFLLIERTLRMAGLLGQCERVDSSEALNAALAQKRWDLVLSDYAVPGMYFTDTLRRFLHHYPNLPLILVSGTIGEVKASVMVEVGAWDYVPKSRLRRLVPAVRRAMERAAALAARRSTTLEAGPIPTAEQRPR
ncbi:MAG TPA: response regulator [Burkholderiaceae bacterium]|jgi:DNA-binding NtrC family response regulator|nr:response regulator [Burkholderiaceae bacterium]